MTCRYVSPSEEAVFYWSSIQSGMEEVPAPGIFFDTHPSYPDGLFASFDQMEDAGWNAIAEWLDGGFPLEISYVDQAEIAESIFEICSAYSIPEMALILQISVYCGWRNRFLVPYRLYNCAPGEFNVSCDHDDACPKVNGYAYFHASAVRGDAINLRKLKFPNNNLTAEALTLGSIARNLRDDHFLPQDVGMYESMRKLAHKLLHVQLSKKSLSDITLDLESIVAKICTILPDDRGGDLKSMEPEEALMLIVHAVILNTIAAIREGSPVPVLVAELEPLTK